MIELALCGFGRWGRNYVKAAEDSGEARVVQVWKRGDILQNVDAVVYAGHPRNALEACRVVLMLNKPILCEKPAGLSLEDAWGIAQAEARSKAFVLVGHQHLFSERIEFLRAADSIAPLSAHWNGPADVHDFGARWDYGPHGVSAILGIRKRLPDKFQHVEVTERGAAIKLWYGESVDRVNWGEFAQSAKQAKIYAETRLRENSLLGPLLYDGYASAEPALTRQVRAFARAVCNKGTDDWRFGAHWAVDVARILETRLDGMARPV